MKKYRFFILIFCLSVNFLAMAGQSPAYRTTEKDGLSEVVFAGQAPLVFHATPEEVKTDMISYLNENEKAMTC
jgi:hypothetical protein